MKLLSTYLPAIFLKLQQADNQVTINSQGTLSHLHFAFSDQKNKIKAGSTLPIAFDRIVKSKFTTYSISKQVVEIYQ